jgi:methylated-DNA-[protein]-cysteine S-methyltransferase
LTFTTYHDSPLGAMELSAGEHALLALHFCDAEKISAPKRVETERNDILNQTIAELDLYFAGKLTAFSVPVFANGTDFQQTVWRELLNIPYGKTISYNELANRLGNPKVIRAAASANGKNPISILIPCHRVIGSDGSLVGYGGDLWRKKRLLELENALPKELF